MKTIPNKLPINGHDPCDADHADPLPHIRRELRSDGVVTLTFDDPDSSANVFNFDALEELEDHLEWIAGRKEVTGVVFQSAKPAVFIAGADLKSLESLNDDQLSTFIDIGQRTFVRIASLKVPTVALIHGACLGGGLELALACDWRLATADDSTKIGLPETQLGILPAWGGSTRLPRLIGLPKALSLILSGKQLNAYQAKKLGIIHEIAFPERLFEAGLKLIKRGKAKLPTFPLVNSPLSAWMLRAWMKQSLKAKTRGHYPALPEALDVATRGVRLDIPGSLANERSAVVRLAASPESRNLIRVFMLQDSARKARYSDSPDIHARTVDRTAVIGAGVMGAGIAQWLSSKGFPVVLQDIAPERVAAGMTSIGKLYRNAVSKRLFSKHEAQRHLDLISPAATPVPLHRADLVIEAATEDLEIKKKIFRDLSKRTGPETVLATNTSALPISDLAWDLEVSHPHRIIGLHFFNPVHRMKLVEVVLADTTSAETVETALRFVRRIGKLPVVVKDRPGFLVNRILMPYLIEAGRLFDLGVDPKKIDAAMLDFGMPMGPMRLLDEVGLDVGLHVAGTMEEAYGARMKVPDVFRHLVDSGQFGRKCGRGFYRYDGKGKKPVVSQAALDCRRHQDSHSARKLTREAIQERLSLLMVNEAFRCLEEEVVNRPDDVDLAMIMGTGFAPFRGGPIQYARTLGLGEVGKRLMKLADEEGERFVPCARLEHAAQRGL